MPYLVDGNNLIGEAAAGSSSAREDLVRDLAARLRGGKARIVVVFDGGPPSGGRGSSSLGSLSVRYAGSRSADDAIVDHLRGTAAAKDWHVVTNDRGLAARVRELGAHVVSTADFRHRLAAPEGGSRPEGSGSVEEWMDFFSDPRNRNV